MNDAILYKHIADWLAKQFPAAVEQVVRSIGGLVWKGTYQIGSSYGRGDMVKYNNALWIAVNATSSQPTLTSEDWDHML